MSGFFRLWVWRLAWRDARRGLRPLLLSMISVILAVASVVAAFSFRDNLQFSVQVQAKSLLGADLALGSRAAFTSEQEALFRDIGGDQSRQVGFASMAYFPRTGDSRLVQVRAIEGNFPYYGALEAEPEYLAAAFGRGANALVDQNVMLQFNAKVGDRLKIGEQEFHIAGRLRKIPGEAIAFSLISPRIYIPMAYLNATELLQKGSLVRYRVFFKLPAGIDADTLVRQRAPEFERLGLQPDTVSRRAASIAAATENLARYLTLAVFVAVLLAAGCVASVVHVVARVKARSVAVLRCIGAQASDTVWVFAIQVSVVALLSSVAGAGLGVVIQNLLPLALRDFVAVDTVVRLAPGGIAAGVAVGTGAALLSALIPLLPLRRVSPLSALRAAFDAERAAADWLVWVVFALAIAGIWGFATWTTGSVLLGSWFTGGVLAVCAVLLTLAHAGAAGLRRLAPSILPFPLRQGLANLHRPSNQTAAVMLAVGVGVFLLVTVQSAQNMLLAQVSGRAGAGDPNMVLFDVQRGQRQDIADLLAAQGVALREQVPIVTMRLGAINDRGADALRAARKISSWALRREYRSTYRATLADGEEIVAGQWFGKVVPGAEPVPVSIEQGIAQTLGVAVGDRLDFEIQGVTIATRIASLRRVDWQRIRPNFFVVFPEGVLESAPQFFAVVARAPSMQAAADLQRALVMRFPNVSAIDLSLILSTIDSIMAKVSAALRFVALFTIATGCAVLASAVLGSRAQRLRESILLKTLGARRSQVLGAIAAEYAALGLLAGLAGAVLALGATWALGFYFFGTAVSIDGAAVVAIVALVIVASVAAGAAGCWGIFRRSALEALRSEA